MEFDWKLESYSRFSCLFLWSIYCFSRALILLSASAMNPFKCYMSSAIAAWAFWLSIAYLPRALKRILFSVLSKGYEKPDSWDFVNSDASFSGFGSSFGGTSRSFYYDFCLGFSAAWTFKCSLGFFSTVFFSAGTRRSTTYCILDYGLSSREGTSRMIVFYFSMTVWVGSRVSNSLMSTC